MLHILLLLLLQLGTCVYCLILKVCVSHLCCMIFASFKILWFIIISLGCKGQTREVLGGDDENSHQEKKTDVYENQKLQKELEATKMFPPYIKRTILRDLAICDLSEDHVHINCWHPWYFWEKF